MMCFLNFECLFLRNKHVKLLVIVIVCYDVLPCLM